MSSTGTTSNPTPWIKAEASNGSNGCVRLRRNGNAVEMSDSKNPDGPVLSFTGHEATTFMDAVRKGEFNHLLADLV